MHVTVKELQLYQDNERSCPFPQYLQLLQQWLEQLQLQDNLPNTDIPSGARQDLLIQKVRKCFDKGSLPFIKCIQANTNEPPIYAPTITTNA